MTVLCAPLKLHTEDEDTIIVQEVRRTLFITAEVFREAGKKAETVRQEFRTEAFLFTRTQFSFRFLALT